MKPASETSQIPLGKLGWLIVALVVAAPLLFFALVTPAEPERPEPIGVVALPPSKLAAVGLNENRDWDGLPEIFALWAPKAYWRNNRTRFAYWNPGLQAHAYFFEARRTTKGYRFQVIVEPHDEGFQWDPDAAPDDPLRLYLPIRPRPEDPVQPLEEKAPTVPRPPSRS